MGGAAVLDKETGLVWERSPSVPAQTWSGVEFRCNKRTTGGRLGWRVPTLQELASLAVPDPEGDGLALPSGHFFINVQPTVYWSATSDFEGGGLFRWTVNFGEIGDKIVSWNSEEEFHPGWCVRGEQGVNPQ